MNAFDLVTQSAIVAGTLIGMMQTLDSVSAIGNEERGYFEVVVDLLELLLGPVLLWLAATIVIRPEGELYFRLLVGASLAILACSLAIRAWQCLRFPGTTTRLSPEEFRALLFRWRLGLGLTLVGGGFVAYAPNMSELAWILMAFGALMATQTVLVNVQELHTTRY